MRNPLHLAALAASLAFAGPTIAHAQSVPQVLEGLMTGNQDRDRAVRDAYERGYQKGRQDEAAFRRNRRFEEDRGSYRDRGPPQYDPRDNPYSR